MESIARPCGVYGGEYAPTGLRLFAWWKKNGEKRLQKAGSGSTQIRSYVTASDVVLLYAGYLGVQARSAINLCRKPRHLSFR
jgi:hypothetical protein